MPAQLVEKTSSGVDAPNNLPPAVVLPSQEKAASTTRLKYRSVDGFVAEKLLICSSNIIFGCIMSTSRMPHLIVWFLDLLIWTVIC